MPKNVQTTTQLHSFHMLVKLYSKSFKLGFINTWTESFYKYKLSLEKAEEPEIKFPISVGWSKKQSFRKHLLLLYRLHQSLCVDHNKLWKILIEIQKSKSHGHFKISKSRGKLKKSCLVLCKSMDCSTPCRDGFSCLSLFLKFAQIYVIWVGDAI